MSLGSMSSPEPRWWATEHWARAVTEPWAAQSERRAAPTSVQARQHKAARARSLQRHAGPGADSDIVLELGWPGPPSTSREWDFSQEEEGTGETAAWIPDRYWWHGLLWHLWSSIDLSSARYRAHCLRPAPVRRRGPYQMQSINLQN